jgi:hypothetical protein
MPSLKRLAGLLVVISLLLTIVSPIGVNAATKQAASKSSKSSGSGDTEDLSKDITQSYNADPSVQLGMVVKLKDKDPKSVEPVKAEDATKILGVVIPQSNATIVLTPQSVTKQQVLVTNNGHFSMLVSNQNGPVKVGDYIMISAIAGIGMKAGDSSDTQVIGKAAGNFTGTANVIGQVDLSDTLGRKTSVSIGRVPIDIQITHNPLFQKHADYVPAGLGKLAQTVATHPVSTARIYLGGIIILITAFIAINMFYSGIRGGMIAVGRNPLTKKSIIGSLIQTVVAGLIVFTAGVFAVYLILKL